MAPRIVGKTIDVDVRGRTVPVTFPRGIVVTQVLVNEVCTYIKDYLRHEINGTRPSKNGCVLRVDELQILEAEHIREEMVFGVWREAVVTDPRAEPAEVLVRSMRRRRQRLARVEGRLEEDWETGLSFKFIYA